MDWSGSPHLPSSRLCHGSGVLGMVEQVRVRVELGSEIDFGVRDAHDLLLERNGVLT